MNVLTCDLLASRHIQQSDLLKERDLMRSCWWEYRGVHPSNRTILFAAAFLEIYQDYIRKYRNHKTAEYAVFTGGYGANGIFRDLEEDKAHAAKLQAIRDGLACRTEQGQLKKIPNKNQSAEWQQAHADLNNYLKPFQARKQRLQALWRGRQAADELQISYRVFVRASFERAAALGFKHFPTPNQIYNDKAKVAALDAQVDELERYIPTLANAGLQTGSNAVFKGEFDAWLYDLAMLRRHHKDLAFRRYAQLGYITPDQAEAWILLAEQA
jgi:hypothetical protein